MPIAFRPLNRLAPIGSLVREIGIGTLVLHSEFRHLSEHKKSVKFQ